MKINTVIVFFIMLLPSVLCGLDPSWQEDMATILAEERAEGCLLMLHLPSNEMFVYNNARTHRGRLPASTSKIFNALQALEMGIADETTVIQWDGEEWPFDSWNRDQTLESAFRNSVVWAFQVLVRQMDRNSVLRNMEDCAYGNKVITGPLDTWWLEGDFRITPHQQLEFLKRLYLNHLPFSWTHQSEVKKIMLLEARDGRILYGKTGTVTRQEPQIGWFVGYLEDGEGVWIFVMNYNYLDSRKTPWGSNGKKMIIRLFEQWGLF